MQQYRLGGHESTSREEVGNFFSQANTQRWQPGDDEPLNLAETVKQAVKDRLHDEAGDIGKTTKLRNVYGEVKAKLEDSQMIGVIPETEKLPTGFSTRDSARLKTLADKYRLISLAEMAPSSSSANKAKRRQKA
jgi:hypothetical protein